MDQKDLAIALDKSPSVISALVNNVSGKAAAGKKLKLKALDYLNARIKSSESVVSGRQKSEVYPVELREQSAEYVTTDEWKRRALIAEQEVERLRAALHLATAPRTVERVNSVPPSVPAETSRLIAAAENAGPKKQS